MESKLLYLLFLTSVCFAAPLHPRSLPVSVYDYYEFLEIPRHLQSPDSSGDMTPASSFRSNTDKIRPSAPFKNQPSVNTRPRSYQDRFEERDYNYPDRSHSSYKFKQIKPNPSYNNDDSRQSQSQHYYKERKPTPNKEPSKYYYTDDEYNIKTEEQNERPYIKSEQKPILIQKGNKYYKVEDPVYYEDEFNQSPKIYAHKKKEYKYPQFNEPSDNSRRSIYKQNLAGLPIQNQDHDYNNKQADPLDNTNQYNYERPTKDEPIEYEYYDDPPVSDYHTNPNAALKKETVVYDDHIPQQETDVYDYYDDSFDRSNNEEYEDKDAQSYKHPQIQKTPNYYEDDDIDSKKHKQTIKEKRQAHPEEHLDANGREFASKAAEVEHKSGPGRLAFQIHGQNGPHSYRFGYDTGKGHNRQFRYEERDNYGQVHGRYGFYDEHGELQVVNYSAHPKHGFSADVPHH